MELETNIRETLQQIAYILSRYGIAFCPHNITYKQVMLPTAMELPTLKELILTLNEQLTEFHKSTNTHSRYEKYLKHVTCTVQKHREELHAS